MRWRVHPRRTQRGWGAGYPGCRRNRWPGGLHCDVLNAAPSLLVPRPRSCAYCRGRPSEFLSLIHPAISRIAWRLIFCSCLGSHFYLEVQQRPVPGLSGPAAMAVLVVTLERAWSAPHAPTRAVACRPASHFLAAAPSQTQLRDGRCPESVGRQAQKNVRAYAVVLQTVPTRSSRTAFSSPHLLCQYLDNARSDDSCHLTTSHHRVDSAPSLVRNTLPCPRLVLSAQRPRSASCSDRGPPLRPTHRPRSQGSGLTVLSPELLSANEL